MAAPSAAAAGAAMGVRGLTGFVEEHGGFLAPVRLRRTKLVLDGSSLYHWLHAGCGADARRGGDYGALAAAAGAFFGRLRACGVAACVLLDGGRGAADAKLATLRERAGQRLRAARRLARGGDPAAGPPLLVPLLAREAFVQALRRLGVPLAQCLGEADRELAALANRWGCPVLALDSDFCVFELRAGYCPLSHFEWRRVRDDGDDDGGDAAGPYIPARLFRRESFCSHFGTLEPALLPLFAAMAGNDYGQPPALAAFFARAPLGAACCGHGRGRRGHLPGLLRWLSRFAGPAEAIEGVLQYVGERRRSEAREQLRAAMDGYAPCDGDVEALVRRGRYESREARASGLPPWVLAALAAGELSPFVSNALRLGSVFLPAQVEDTERGSAHDAARPVRQVLYGLLRSAARAPTGPPGVCEFGRNQKTVEKRFVEAASLPAGFCVEQFPLERLREAFGSASTSVEDKEGTYLFYAHVLEVHTAHVKINASFIWKFSSLLQVPMSCRLMLLLETLGVKKRILESVPSHLQLPFAVTCYWIRSSEPKVELHQLKALLLMLVAGELHRTPQDGDPTDLSCEDDGIVYNLFPNEKEKKLEDTAFDLNAAHSFCQWQCCLQMGFYLNQLLGSPLAEPDLSRTYNGTLVHRLCQEFKSSPSGGNFISTPKMAQFYQDLLETVKSTVPPDFFQKKPQTKSKRCRKKKSCKKTKAPRGTIAETQPFCNLNRFASLKVED